MTLLQGRKVNMRFLRRRPAVEEEEQRVKESRERKLNYELGMKWLKTDENSDISQKLWLSFFIATLFCSHLFFLLLT